MSSYANISSPRRQERRRAVQHYLNRSSKRLSFATNPPSQHQKRKHSKLTVTIPGQSYCASSGLGIEVDEPKQRRQQAPGHTTPRSLRTQGLRFSPMQRRFPSARQRCHSTALQATNPLRSKVFGVGSLGTYKGAWKTLPPAPQPRRDFDFDESHLYLEEGSGSSATGRAKSGSLEASATPSDDQIFAPFQETSRCSSPISPG